MNLTESNLITLDTELKQGQRCIRIGNSIIPIGVGGIFAPGSNSSAPAGADVTLGVVDSQGRFQALRFEGTQASNSGSAIQVQNYKTWNSTLPAPQPVSTGVDFYKCTYVSSDSSMTWRGRKAVLNDGIYSFQSDSTEGLSFSSLIPVVNSIYTQGAFQKISYLPLDTLNEGLVFYAPFTSVEATAATGQTLSYEQGHNISADKQDGILCLKSVADPNDTFGIRTGDSDLPMSSNPCTISIWLKLTSIWNNTNMDSTVLYGNPQRGFGVGRANDIYDGDLFIAYLAYSSDSPKAYLSPLEWHNITSVYTNSTRKLYIDGSCVFSESASIDTSSGYLEFMQNRYADMYFTAARIYNRALSDFEIKMLANEFTPTA